MLHFWCATIEDAFLGKCTEDVASRFIKSVVYRPNNAVHRYEQYHIILGGLFFGSFECWAACVLAKNAQVWMGPKAQT